MSDQRDPTECPHCRAGEPSVWDGVLFHYAHPAGGDKLKMCVNPWSERCRGCSAEGTAYPVLFCGACEARRKAESA
jgi:hypothetical protein